MNTGQRERYLRRIERKRSAAVAAYAGRGDAVSYSVLVELEIPKLISLARQRPVLTDAEAKALRSVFSYMSNERNHYEANPDNDHIWLKVVTAANAIERLCHET